MFLEYRKELRVIFNNLGALVSHHNVTYWVIIGRTVEHIVSMELNYTVFSRKAQSFAGVDAI